MNVYCPKCEAANHEDTDVCSLCGHRLGAPVPAKRRRDRPSMARALGRRLRHLPAGVLVFKGEKAHRSVLFTNLLLAVIGGGVIFARSRGPHVTDELRAACATHDDDEIAVILRSYERARASGQSAPDALGELFSAAGEDLLAIRPLVNRNAMLIEGRCHWACVNMVYGLATASP